MKTLERIIDVVDGAAQEFAEFMGPVVAIGGSAYLVWQVFFR